MDLIHATAHPFERYRPLIDDWPRFLEACSRPLPTVIWTNQLRVAPSALVERLRQEQVTCEPVAWYKGAFRIAGHTNPGATLSYLAGLYHIQEEVSLLPIHLLDPEPGQRVLDLCAAPGGKTLQSAVRLENRGTIVANDRSGTRLNVLRTSSYRLGLTNVSTTAGDAATFAGPAGWFDCVIADVPCSCEGTSRKHRSVVDRSSTSQSTALAQKQRAILNRAIKMCRPGGRIVYATCTYAPEENECVVNAVLQDAPSVRILPLPSLGLQTTPGITEWSGVRLHPDLRHTIRVWPHHNDTGGFYVALLEKTALE